MSLHCELGQSVCHSFPVILFYSSSCAHRLRTGWPSTTSPSSLPSLIKSASVSEWAASRRPVPEREIVLSPYFHHFLVIFFSILVRWVSFKSHRARILFRESVAETQPRGYPQEGRKEGRKEVDLHRSGPYKEHSGFRTTYTASRVYSPIITPVQHPRARGTLIIPLSAVLGYLLGNLALTPRPPPPSRPPPLAPLSPFLPSSSTSSHSHTLSLDQYPPGYDCHYGGFIPQQQPMGHSRTAPSFAAYGSARRSPWRQRTLSSRTKPLPRPAASATKEVNRKDEERMDLSEISTSPWNGRGCI
ncbi:hypothetical protein C8R45DRAFT_605857 [Mycena sanguinolenta]|nr:hypothetical protein C8R45DRAFT_605857 [Mycena sanguinolenta]